MLRVIQNATVKYDISQVVFSRCFKSFKIFANEETQGAQRVLEKGEINAPIF